MKHTWRQWLWKVLGDRRAGSVSCRVKRRPRLRPTLEILEDRTMPSGVFPFVESINRTTPAGPTTNASAVSYAVTFSEPVTGVNPTDFQLATTRTVGTTLTQVTPVSGSPYTVTYVNPYNKSKAVTIPTNLFDTLPSPEFSSK